MKPNDFRLVSLRQRAPRITGVYDAPHGLSVLAPQIPTQSATSSNKILRNPVYSASYQRDTIM